MVAASRRNVFNLDDYRTRRPLNPTDETAAKNWLFQRIEKAAATGPFAEIAPLDHGIALELLKNNDSNRRIRPSKLSQYIEDMKHGRWSLNGETVVISTVGKLLDGQHRCISALDVVREKDAPRVTFLFGIDKDARRTIDTGAKRNASDILQLEGIRNAAMASSAARMLIALENGKGKSFQGRDRISTSVVVQRVLDDTELQLAADDIHNMSRATIQGVTVGVICAAYYLMRKKNRSKAREFVEAVFQDHHQRRSAEQVTYSRLKELVEMGGRERRLEALVRGWNMFRNGNVQAIPLMGELPRIL